MAEIPVIIGRRWRKLNLRLTFIKTFFIPSSLF